MQKVENDKLTQLGFKLNRGGVHAARTIMLEDLNFLLDYVPSPNATRADYIRAIVRDNCLGKRSARNRVLTKKHLFSLYGLNPEITIFRALRYFWERDPDSRPLIALLCAYARDGIVQITTPFILNHKEGEIISREKLEAFIEAGNPNRYTGATLKSIAQNINSSWTKSGHLEGTAKKIRTRATPGPGAAAYALFLAYLTGSRGQMLFATNYLKILETPAESAMELAELAARRGWIVFNRIGPVIEVSFPNQLTQQEKELLNE